MALPITRHTDTHKHIEIQSTNYNEIENLLNVFSIKMKNRIDDYFIRIHHCFDIKVE